LSVLIGRLLVILCAPFAAGTMDVPPFNREALISALPADQAGEGTL